MIKLFKYFLMISFLTLLTPSCTSKNMESNPNSLEQSEDYKNVKAAIQNYVDALYLVDSIKIDKSVDKKLRKIGFWYNPDTKDYVDNLEMTHNQLSNLAVNWNKKGNQADENSLKLIEIFDVNTKTASAKLTAVWGIDLFHLAKVKGKWKIVNVIWQSQPNL